MFLTSQENCLILKELVDLRAQKSALLGFKTHADFVLEMNMAKNYKTVMNFLGNTTQPLLPASSFTTCLMSAP